MFYLDHTSRIPTIIYFTTHNKRKFSGSNVCQKHLKPPPNFCLSEVHAPRFWSALVLTKVVLIFMEMLHFVATPAINLSLG
jgi:hypothetical protein